MDAIYFGVGQIAGSHVAKQLTGVVLKDNAEDMRKLGAYVDNVVKERSRKSKAWKEMLAAFKAQKSVS